MAIRGIDTQMMAAKPADLSATQAKVQKQTELHMQQTATNITKDIDAQKERTAATAKSEGKRVGVEEREKRGGKSKKERKDEEPEHHEEKPPFKDPLLSLPVDKGKFARREQHFIDLRL